jgi:hypothetical protein
MEIKRPDDADGRVALDRLLTPSGFASAAWLAGTEQGWQLVPVSPKVPEFLRERIERAKDLFLYSYFRYGFQDAALLYMIATYEEALSQVPDTKGATFEKMIDAAIEKGICPERHKSFRLHAMRKVRNSLAHGSSLLGNSISQASLLLVVDLINCAFDEDARRTYPPLFEQRRRELEAMRRLNDTMKAIPPGSMRPGDGVAVVGADEYYPPGTYECGRCHVCLTMETEDSEIPTCHSCGWDVFLYRPLPESREAVDQANDSPEQSQSSGC